VLLILILLSVVPSLIISITAYSQTVVAITDVGFNSLKKNTNFAEEKVSEAIQSITNELALYTDFRVHSFLLACGEKNESAQLSAALRLFQYYSEAIKENPYRLYIEDIGVVSKEGVICGQSVGLQTLDDEERLSSFFSNVSDSVTIVPAADLFDDVVANQSYLFARPVRSSSGLAGIVYIRLNVDLFEHIFSSLYDESTTRYGIVTLSGRNISNTEPVLFKGLVKNANLAEAVGNATGVNINASKYYLFIGSADQYGWHVAAADSKANLLLSLTIIRKIAILSIIVSILTALLVSLQVNRAIFVPIASLQEHMQLVRSNHLDVKPVYHGSYEIEQLYESFNSMIQRIHHLMDSLVEEQNNLRTAELKALQAQINPHFLYNSFNSIVHVAEQGKMSIVIDIVMALARYYRSVLSNGMDHISLETEISSTQAYLEIMQIHCYDILRYSFEVDDSIKKCTSFPKLSLQPIVENAIFHGLMGIENGGWIYIQARVDEKNQLTISVRDTGVGMTEQALKSLRTKISLGMPSTSEASSNYGLANVDQRLRLFFGSSYHMQIVSKVDVGTTVTLTASLNTSMESETE
jgi:two-component system sensor histidine kinase YesM